MVNTASPALINYLLRHNLVVDDSVERFAVGVAAYAASTSWMDWIEENNRSIPGGCEILEYAPAPSRRAMYHAHFFTGLLVARDLEYGHVASLAVVLAAAFRRMWPEVDPNKWLYGDWAYELGWYVASEASGAGVSWEDDHPPHELRVPSCDMLHEEFFAKDGKG